VNLEAIKKLHLYQTRSVKSYTVTRAL